MKRTILISCFVLLILLLSGVGKDVPMTKDSGKQKGEIIHLSDATQDGLADSSTRGNHFYARKIDGTNLDVGRFTSIDLDQNGLPHISYYNDTRDRINYAYLAPNGEWIFNSPFPAHDGFTDIKINQSTNSPHISYCDDANSDSITDLAYMNTTGDPPQLSSQSVDQGANNFPLGNYSSIAFSGNNPSISYYNYYNMDLKYANYNGASWSVQTVDEGGDVGKFSSLALDSSGTPIISYFNNSDTTLKSAKYSGTSWTTQLIDDQGLSGTHTSICFDSNDVPHISYQSDHEGDGKGELTHAYLGGFPPQWQVEIVETSQRSTGFYTSIASDGQDGLHISYYEIGTNILKYAYKSGDARRGRAAWDISVVDSQGMVGKYSAIAVDGNNRPHIAYWDETNRDLKYAVVDNVAPSLQRDATDNDAYTGDPFTFNITASDDWEVDNVSVNVSGGQGSQNFSLQYDGSNWLRTVIIPDDGREFQYTIYIRDKANNYYIHTPQTRTVIDNDGPEIISDNSSDTGYTGDEYIFRIGVKDNIEVGSVRVEWNQEEGNQTIDLANTDDIWDGTITLNIDRIAPLNYTVHALDINGNPCSHPKNKIVPIKDNDIPKYINNYTSGEPQTGEPCEITVDIKDNIQLEGVFLKYSFDGGGALETKSMDYHEETDVEGEFWRTAINVSENAREMLYFFIARDGVDNNTLNTAETIGPARVHVKDVTPPNAVAGKGGGEVAKIKPHSSFTFFGGNSTDNIEITSYTWELFYDNENRILEGREAVFGFDLPGEYNVTLTVRDAADNADTDYIIIQVGGGGTIEIHAAVNDISIEEGGEYKFGPGTELFFDAKQSMSPDGVDIDFFQWIAKGEDGLDVFEMGGNEVQYTFGDVGRYDITLTIRDIAGNEGSITFTIIVEKRDISEMPVARVSFNEIDVVNGNDYEIKVGTEIHFNADQSTDDGNVESYRWVVESDSGEAELFGVGVSHKFNNIGEYTITLTITDNSRETGSITFLIRVTEEGARPKFVVGPIVNRNGEPVEGAEVSFEFNGEQYRQTTDVNGHAEFDLNPDDLPNDLLLQVSKDDITIEWERGGGIPNFSPFLKVGPILDTKGDPVVGAEVSFEFEGNPYIVKTNENGMAVFKISAEDVPGDTHFTAIKNGKTIEWIQGGAIPPLEAEEDDDGSATPLIIGAVVVLAIVIIIILLIVKKRKKKSEGEERIAELESELEVEKKKGGSAVAAPRGKPPRKEPPICTPPPVKARQEVRAAPESPIVDEPAVEGTEEEMVTEDEDEVWGEEDMEDMDELPLPPPPEDLLEALPALELEAASSTIKNIIPGYIITDKLGSGGFATVYKAINKDGVAVAIKLPKFLDETVDSDVLKKFQAEADIWKKLKHKNIVTFLDSNVRPIPYMTIELMEGGNLAGLLKDHRLAVKDAKPLMLQIVDGLSYAHRMASVHRDIKPENILFTKDGVPKIADWGIGKFMASESVSQSIGTKGTFAYAAPEQFDRETYGEVDWSTDIFQIGIVFYQMLTGVNPFMADELARVMGLIITTTPKNPSDLNPEVPKVLGDIVMKCLAKKKEERWRSTDVLYSKLRGMEKKKRANLKKYRRSLERALKDGKISEDEDIMLLELREHMNITDKEHEGMVEEILG